MFPDWKIEFRCIKQPEWPDIQDLSEIKTLPSDFQAMLETCHGFPSRFIRPAWYTKWFFHSPSPTHALVEVRTNRIWLVSNQGPDILRLISDIMQSKMYTAVIDLGQPMDCLDNACCMDWYTNRDTAWYDTLNNYEILLPRNIQKLDCMLINRPTSVSKEDDDLQQQLFLLYSIMHKMYWDSLSSKDRGRLVDPGRVGAELLDEAEEIRAQVKEEIGYIFQTKLYTNDITKALLDYFQYDLGSKTRAYKCWGFSNLLFSLLPTEIVFDEI